MRNRKSLFLLIVALMTATISFVLISIWGYHFYFANKNKPAQLTEEQKSGISHNGDTDSLKSLVNTFYEETEINTDSTLLDSSADKNLAAKIIEYIRLKKEIGEILRKRSSEQEMNQASEKIARLQLEIEVLKNENDSIIRENQRLSQIEKELKEKKETDVARENVFSKKPASNSVAKLPVLVSHLRFAAYSLSEVKAATNIADRAERLSGSFQVNIKPFNSDNSIFVVIVQPDGKILKGQGSRAKSFMSRDGKKNYSALLHFDNKKDNRKRLYFTIDAHDFQKGKYTMQIYHQGVMIGRLTRTLY